MKNIYRWLSLATLLWVFSASVWGADFAAVIDDIQRRGDAAIARYDPANRVAAGSELSALYFDVFENSGLEMDLGARAPALKNELEILFGALNAQALRGDAPAALRESWARVSAKLGEARALYAEQQAESFWSVTLKALLILLREGVEAMLVLGALAAYLRRVGAADRVWVLYTGAGLAVPLSLLTGWALLRGARESGLSGGMIEAVSLLAAAAMLIYLSFWLYSRREAQRWQAWIAGKMEYALSGGSLLALAGAACLAVYREGAETVLFFAALNASAPGQQAALTTGVALATTQLAALFLLIRSAAMRLPLRQFFGATALLLYGMAVVFVGQALVELQAMGALPSLYLAGFPSISWAGVSPTAQGLAAQGVLLMLPVLSWAWIKNRREAPGRANA